MIYTSAESPVYIWKPSIFIVWGQKWQFAGQKMMGSLKKIELAMNV